MSTVGTIICCIRLWNVIIQMVTLCSYMYYTHKFRSWQLLGIKHLRFMGWPTRSISLNFMCNNPKHCSSNAISVSCRNDLHQRFVSSIGKQILWPTKSTLECAETLICTFLLMKTWTKYVVSKLEYFTKIAEIFSTYCPRQKPLEPHIAY